MPFEGLYAPSRLIQEHYQGMMETCLMVLVKRDVYLGSIQSLLPTGLDCPTCLLLPQDRFFEDLCGLSRLTQERCSGMMEPFLGELVQKDVCLGSNLL